MSGPTLLVDVGSTVIKLCTRTGPDRFSAVEQVPRRPGVPPGEQVRALAAGRAQTVRICSSANGGIRVGILGLSRRHSVAVAVRAATEAGGNVVHQGLLTDSPAAVPDVDVLVLVGGVDGADPGRLRAAVAAAPLAGHRYGALVWAGADVPDVVAALPPHIRTGNVLDRQLRPRLTGLAGTIRDLYVRDLVDAKGLGALAGIATGPIWPTPAVVGLAARRLATRRPAGQRIPPAPPVPFVVVDVGGATTDVFACAELRAEAAARSAPGESVVRYVFPDLGVAVSRLRLLRRLDREPELVELVAAVAPESARALHAAVCAGDPTALDPPAGFLTCLYLALRRVAGSYGLDLAKAAGFVVTGGARGDTPADDIRRVVDAVRGRSAPPATVLLDQDYQLWAYGLQDVPADGPQDVPG